MTDLSLGAMAARLLIEGALPTVEDDTIMREPIFPGRDLLPEERDKLNLPNSGVGIAYPNNSGGAVFAHLLGSDVNIWFFGGDYETTPALVESELKRAYPQVSIRPEIKHPEKAHLRSRGYRVDFSNGRVGFIEVMYPTPDAKQDRGLWIKIRAAQRQN